MSTRPPHYCISIPASFFLPITVSVAMPPPGLALAPNYAAPSVHIDHAHSRLSSFDLHPLNLPAAPSLMRREYYARSRPNRESLKILKVGNFGEAGIKVPKWPRKWPQFDYTPSNNNFRRCRRRLTFLPLPLSLFLFARSFFPPLFLT